LGRVVESISGGGSKGYFAPIQGVAESKKWVSADIVSGAWSITLETGTKPHCGEFCLELECLSPGTYVITPQSLAAGVAVAAGEGRLARVEFSRS